MNEPRPQVNLMLALTGASASIACVDITRLNGVIRSPGAIHNFIVFLASGIATKESCISRLETKGARMHEAVLHKVLELFHTCEA